MKILSTTLIGLLAYFISAAQPMAKKDFKVGAGLSLAIPMFNLDFSKAGSGVDVMAQYGVLNNLSITVDAGFTGLPGKKNYPSTGIVPIRLGLRYFPATKFYLGAKAGLGIYTILKASANHTAYSLSSGYFIKDRIEAGIFYDGYSNHNSSFGYGGLRLAYNFIH